MTFCDEVGVALEEGQPLLSVVVASYNGARVLPGCLDSLANQDSAFPFEVEIVDDGSDDETGDIAGRYAARHPDSFRAISIAHAGLAAARNAGAAEARGDWLLFLDDDTRLPEGFVGRLARLLEAPPADVLGFADHPLPEDSYMAKSIRYLELASRRTIERRYAVKGAAVACRRDVFWKLGGFAKERRYYQQEDSEFVDRARSMGLQVAYLTEPWIYHRSPTAIEYVRKNWRSLKTSDAPDGWHYYRVPHTLALLVFSVAATAALGSHHRLTRPLTMVALGTALAGSLAAAQIADGPKRYSPGIMVAALLRVLFMPLGAWVYIWRRREARCRSSRR